MSTAVKRGLWMVALLLCLGAVVWGVRSQLALGEAPITPAPTPSSAIATPSAPASTSAAASSTATAASSALSDDRSATPSMTAASTSTEPAGGSAHGTPEEHATPEGPTAPSAEPTAEPTAEEGTQAEPAPSSSEPGADEDSLLSGPAAPQGQITAAPIHVEVRHEGQDIIGASIELTQMDENGEIIPDPGTVGWYGPPQWGTTPGETSRYPGVLAGHVVWGGEKDVFYYLDQVTAGDVVVITYDDGTQAAFRADADARSVDKDDLTQDPAWSWAWELPSDGSKVTLITCRLVEGGGLSLLSPDNWVVQATRVE